jgi:RND family efflux transporter MFP subunit
MFHPRRRIEVLMSGFGSVQTKPPVDPLLDSQSRLRLFRLASVVAVILVAAFAVGWMLRWHLGAVLATETRELATPTVAVVLPAEGKLTPGLLLPAEIKPWAEAPIYARASGYLKRRFVDIGSKVKAGELLAEIETPELDQELDQARYKLGESMATLALAKITAERYAKLAQTGSISELGNAEKQADFALKTASAAGARAEVRRLESLKAFGRVTAPFAGTITARSTDVGDLISASGGKILFRLSQSDKVRVYVNLPQPDALGIALGQLAEVLIPELPKQVFPAVVVRTAGEISDDSRTLLVELEVKNPPGRILAGSFAQVRFTGLKHEARLALPANTLLFGAEGPQVGVVRKGGKVELRSVKLGRDFGQVVEILGGVSAKDKVILNPSDSLESGTLVRVAPPARKTKTN